MKKIPLTRGRFAIVDDEDYPYLSRFHWHCSSEASGSERAERSIRIENKIVDILMESFLIEIPKRYQVLHKDHNGLNNQKDNLLIGFIGQRNHLSKKMTSSKGRKYTSIYKGVCLDKKRKRKNCSCCWRAYISLNTDVKELKKQIKIGYFKTEKEAGLAYNKKAKELYGEFAYQNKID